MKQVSLIFWRLFAHEGDSRGPMVVKNWHHLLLLKNSRQQIGKDIEQLGSGSEPKGETGIYEHLLLPSHRQEVAVSGVD